MEILFLFLFPFVLLAIVYFVAFVYIKGAFKNRSRTTTRSKMEMNQRIDQAKKQVQSTIEQTTGRNANINELLSMSPAELYQILKKGLPASHHAELDRVFKTENPMRELLRFLRRKDVWPFVRTILKNGINSVKSMDSTSVRRAVDAVGKKIEQAIPPTEYSDDYGAIEEIETVTQRLKEEQEEIEREYDAYGTLYDNMLLSSKDSDYETTLQRETRIKEKRDSKEKVDQAWLRQAIMGSIILEPYEDR